MCPLGIFLVARCFIHNLSHLVSILTAFHVSAIYECTIGHAFDLPHCTWAVGKVLGLSKLARIVEMFSRRLQVSQTLFFWNPALRCKNGWRGRLLTRCGRRSNPPELVLSSARATCAWSFFYWFFLRASQICFVRVFFIWLISLFRWCVVFKRSTARLWPARCSATSGAQFLILTWNFDRDDPKTRAEFLTLAKDS